MCTAIGSFGFPEIRIKEKSLTEFEFWCYTPRYGGIGILEVSTNDTFTFNGVIATEPTTPYFNPIYCYKFDVSGIAPAYYFTLNDVKGRIYSGATGMFIATTTNHPIYFKTYTNGTSLTNHRSKRCCSL